MYQLNKSKCVSEERSFNGLCIDSPLGEAFSKSQLIINRQLKDENTQLRQHIERLKLQISQIELHKNQSLNLRKQLKVCEEKLKFYDAENARRQATVEEHISLVSTKESKLTNEMIQKNKIIADLEKRADNADRMKDENTKLKTMIEELSNQLKTREFTLNSNNEELQRNV